MDRWRTFYGYFNEYSSSCIIKFVTELIVNTISLTGLDIYSNVCWTNSIYNGENDYNVGYLHQKQIL
jgi:hypothetical protein